jgi:hypothetical protein
MNLLQGTMEITLVSVETLKIHESVYYQLAYKATGSDAIQQMRINPEAFYTDPKPGDRVSVQVVMGNIMGATKLN